MSQVVPAIKDQSCLKTSATMDLSASADAAHRNKKFAVPSGHVHRPVRPIATAQWLAALLGIAALKMFATAERQLETCVRKTTSARV